MAVEREQQNVPVESILELFRLRHLLGHLHQKSGGAELTKILHSPRDAAILARLWVAEDLSLKPVKQSQMGGDRKISQPELSNRLGAFFRANLVEFEFMDRRSKCWRITDQGKEELNNWLENWYLPPDLRDAVDQLPFDPTLVDRVIGLLKTRMEDLLNT